jgi:hypothetical protein
MYVCMHVLLQKLLKLTSVLTLLSVSQGIDILSFILLSDYFRLIQ